jgi:LPS export ABC transporter protein LptC
MEKILAPKPRQGFKRYRGWLLGLLLALGLGAWGIWGGRAPAPPRPAPPPAAEAPSRMEGLALTEIQDGDKRWVLEAQKANFLKERDEIGISGVKVEFFGRPGQRILVKGEEGRLNTKTRILTLEGNVEMESGDLRLKTSIIYYHPADRVLLAPEEVTLEGPTIRVQGKGLRVELAQKKLALAQHRLTQIKTSGGGILR